MSLIERYLRYRYDCLDSNKKQLFANDDAYRHRQSPDPSTNSSDSSHVSFKKGSQSLSD